MFVELIYDKRNFAGLPGARETILNELTKRMQRIFPEAEVRVKPMMTLPAINTDASKHEKELTASPHRPHSVSGSAAIILSTSSRC